MKKLITLSLLAVSLSGWGQLPLFQQDHTSATAGITYDRPVDIHYDGGSRVYSYHSTSTGGTVVAAYNSGTGALLAVTYLSKNGISYWPVRVRTQGGNVYAMFNNVVSGQNRWCIISLNATTGVLNWLRTINSPSNSIDEQGVDFVLDGGNYIYALSNTYDAVNSQSDLSVTKIDITTQVVVWNNQYQNISRDEVGHNIIFRNNSEIYVSAVSVNTTSFLDRGPMLLQIDNAGNYLNSQLYKYSSTCTSARASSAWVWDSGTDLILTCTTYIGADGSGPFWIAKINPGTLTVNLQAHHFPQAIYLNAEIQGVSSSSGNKLLMSGSASMVNTANPGYAHLFFDANTLAFSSGTLYNTTSSSVFSGDIYDTYINNGIDKNIFSAALNTGTSASYYLLKTSALGDNACDQPYVISSSTCVMDFYAMPLTTVAVPASLSIIKLFLIQAMNNSFTQSCLVTCHGCELALMDETVQGEETAAPDNRFFLAGETNDKNEPVVYPNPAKTSVTLDSKGMEVEEVKLLTVAGALVQTVRVNGDRIVLDLSGIEKGVYLLQVKTETETKMIKLVKE